MLWEMDEVNGCCLLFAVELEVVEDCLIKCNKVPFWSVFEWAVLQRRFVRCLQGLPCMAFK